MPQPSKKLRTVVPLIVFGIAVLLISMVIFAPGSDRTRGTKETPASPDAVAAATTESSATTPPVPVEPASSTAPAEPVSKKKPAAPAAPAVEETTPDKTEPSLDGLHVAKHALTPDAPPITLGGFDDPNEWKMQLTLTRAGAGLSKIEFSDVWYTAAAKRQAAEYFSAVGRGETPSVELPVEERYVLSQSNIMAWQSPDGTKMSRDVSVLSTNAVHIGETILDLTLPDYWEQTAAGQFVATVLDDKDAVVARVHRRWELGTGFDITLHQEIENVSDAPLKMFVVQYGPANLDPDRSRYMDRRRFRFGYEFSTDRDPDHVADIIAGGDMMIEMTDATDEDLLWLWPNEVSEADGFTLSWFASTNRYFGLAIHPLINSDGEGSRSLSPLVTKIGKWIQTGVNDEDTHVFTTLTSPSFTVAAGERHDMSMGVFAGPLKRVMLEDEEPYKALNMRGLILYQMSSFCAFCTFSWLANILIIVLSFLDHFILFDWGLAIIGLVIIVRTLLHPITRKSQTGMQRFTRKMGKLKPQMDKLNQKYGDDPKRKQTEQMKLMREHGVNPLQMLGCLPMFLQMPIWIALYAVLYFAFELRQEPAFWGFFQMLWDWPFLADLSSPDHFFYEFDSPHQVLFWHLTGINLLPILLGVLFFVQQKYMSPPTATMTPEQESQQKIMRVMMIVAFPLMLYSAPSGLTLYILTSSSIGIIESRYIRRQVELEDMDSPPPSNSPEKKKTKDPQARAYSKMLERRKSEAKQKQAKSFKKRK